MPRYRQYRPAAPLPPTIFWPLRSQSQVSLVHAAAPKSPTEPALLDELRGLWENWNREMLPLPEHLTPPLSNLAEMLW
jgi:hypothetical protein